MKTHWHGILDSTCSIMLEMAPAKNRPEHRILVMIIPSGPTGDFFFHFFMSIVIVNFIRVDPGRS